MTRALIIIENSEAKSELSSGLARYDVACSFTSYHNGVSEAINTLQPDVLLLEISERLPDAVTRELVQNVKKEKNLPVIALTPLELLEKIDINFEADDFLTSPYDSRELIFRMKRLVATKKADACEQIKCNGLVLDPATCEVTVDGKIVELTFKEYELLRLLAGNRGRVYTREALLDNIWGYDYYGGDRTVDVHVRRLRSKIEDASHTFIETVRNIGYRFVKET